MVHMPHLTPDLRSVRVGYGPLSPHRGPYPCSYSCLHPCLYPLLLSLCLSRTPYVLMRVCSRGGGVDLVRVFGIVLGKGVYLLELASGKFRGSVLNGSA